MKPQPEAASNRQYFKVLADGTQVPASDPRTDHVAVLDTSRSLQVYVNSVGVNGKRAPFKKLTQALPKLDVLGGGWRMASREEAESILDLSRFGPAVDPSLFPGIKPEGHFTSTPAAWAPARAAWWVAFDSGGVCSDNLDNDGWALAVRPAGQ